MCGKTETNKLSVYDNIRNSQATKRLTKQNKKKSITAFRIKKKKLQSAW